jgi:DNA gyrase/topoisomerase IV subunit A
MNKKTISEFINGPYLDYSKYVLYNRAIPSLIDGFKPVQRKIFHVMRKENNFTKVQAVGGRCLEKANYHHGSTSAEEATIKMAQDFIGSNNIPFLQKRGAFGSQLVPDGAAASRYIFVKRNSLMDYIYRDFEICPPSEDLEDPEPKYFLPILPTVLLNGARGIAVGFATNILAYDIKDIITGIEQELNSKDIDFIAPYYDGYKGDIEWDEEDECYYMYGEYEEINGTNIRITEVPIAYSREKYLEFLNKLEDKGLIYDYEDQSDKSWNITIKLPKKSKIWKDIYTNLKLKVKLNENITLIDDNNNVRVYDDVTEIIREFVNFRLGVYTERKNYFKKKLKDEIALLEWKIVFIRMLSKVEDLSKTTKKEIVNKLEKAKFPKKVIEYCMALPVYRINKDEIDRTQKDILELKKELEYYTKITEKELYTKDLKELKNVIKRTI